MSPPPCWNVDLLDLVHPARVLRRQPRLLWVCVQRPVFRSGFPWPVTLVRCPPPLPGCTLSFQGHGVIWFVAEQSANNEPSCYISAPSWNSILGGSSLRFGEFQRVAVKMLEVNNSQVSVLHENVADTRPLPTQGYKVVSTAVQTQISTAVWKRLLDSSSWWQILQRAPRYHF